LEYYESIQREGFYFSYNAKGEVARSAVDANASGAIDEGDRITSYVNEVISAHGTNVRRSSKTVNGVVVSVSDTSLDGLNSWTTSFGRTTHLQTTLNGNGQKTVVVTDPDNSTAIQVYLNGLLMSSTHSVLGATAFSYDAHGRTSSGTRTENGQQRTTSYSYDRNDRTLSVTIPDGRTRGFAYDSMGRGVRETLPDGRSRNYEYHPTGELKSATGADTYPVIFGYDGAGNRTSMTLYRAYPGTADTTSWEYDYGKATAKIYPDGSRVSFSYTTAGRPEIRTWARGVTTTYNYNPAGERISTDYSDDTPDVTYGLNDFGKPSSITDGVGARTIAYNNDFTVSSETIPYISNYSVNYGYDALGRRNAMSLQNGGSAVSTANYGYDAMSRISSVSGGSSLVATASYSRVSGSSLLSSTSVSNGSSNVLNVNRTYDSSNRLTSISSVLSASSVGYSYVYDSSDRRTKVTEEDGSHWNFTYDQYGQVASGRKLTDSNTPIPGNYFQFSYDDIGNFKGENRNGNIFGYSANYLNQYTSRTVPGTVEISGEADPVAKIAIQRLSLGNVESAFAKDVTRSGKYFSRMFALDNTSAPVSEIFKVYAVNANGTLVASQQTDVFLPKTPEIFSEDADGNLLQDGKQSYVWNGENQLITVQKDGDFKTECAYDFIGRRISKKVYTWSADHWSLTSDLKFIFDGWNLVAEIDGTTNSVSTTYLWGEDISGSLQGAGGVGGLISVKDSAGTYFPCFDGGGNIVAYVDSTGKTVAEYSHDPFGKLTSKSGPMADKFKFRFSTKYFDQNTGLYYYGRRYYNPETRRWLNRDPIGERGGSNLYNVNHNDNVNKIDPFGLWSSLCGGDHKAFATQSFYWVRPAGYDTAIDEKVIKNILDLLVSENVNVDSQFFSNDEYHFTRPINEFDVSGKEKEKQNLIQEYRWKYSANLEKLKNRFNENINGEPKYNDCKKALKALGELTHPWQDYYAHAVINYDASYYSSGNNPSNFSFITGNKIGQVTGNPDSPGADMKPASFHIPTLFNTPVWLPDSNGEHYIGEPGDLAPDSSSRRNQTVDFVAGKYNEYLIEKWWPKCFCKFKEELSK